jgi:hypothetical protein
VVSGQQLQRVSHTHRTGSAVLRLSVSHRDRMEDDRDGTLPSEVAIPTGADCVEMKGTDVSRSEVLRDILHSTGEGVNDPLRLPVPQELLQPWARFTGGHMDVANTDSQTLLALLQVRTDL